MRSPMERDALGVFAALSRALGYSSAFGLAVASSLLVGKGFFEWRQPYLALALWVLSTPFFVAYASAFRYDNIGMSDRDRRDAMLLGILFALLLLVIIYLAAGESVETLTSGSALRYALVVVTAQMTYAAFLYTQAGKRDTHIYIELTDTSDREDDETGGPDENEHGVNRVFAVRHALIWPTIFTIAFGLYAGTAISQGSRDLLWVVPMVLSFVVFGLTFRLDLAPARLVLGLVGVAAVVATPVLLSVWPPMADLLTFVVVAAYVAGIEAWRYTSSLKARSLPAPRVVNSYKSTAIVIGAAGPVLLLMHLTGSVGLLGLVLITVHVAIASVIWHVAGSNQTLLGRERVFVMAKLAMGFSVLLILALDRGLADQVDVWVLDAGEGVLWGGLSFVGAVALGVLALNWSRMRKTDGIRGLDDSLSRWRWLNPSALMVFGLGVAFASLILRVASMSPEIASRSQSVFWLALALVLVGLLSSVSFQWLRSVAVAGVLGGLRLLTSIAVGFVAAIPVLMSGELALAMRVGLPFVLAASGAFAVNDFFDRQRDAINHPDRPIPSGRASPRTVLISGVIAFTASLGLAIFFAIPTVFGFQVAAALGAALYGATVAWVPILKGLHAAAIAALPILAGFVAVPGLAVERAFVIAVVLLFVARETLMDVEDAKGDSEYGVGTVAVVAGAARARLMAIGLLALSLGFLFAAANSQRRLLAVVALAVMFSCLAVVYALRVDLRRHVILASWIPMIFGVVLFAV